VRPDFKNNQRKNMVHVEEHLPSKYKTLSANPSTTPKKKKIIASFFYLLIFLCADDFHISQQMCQVPRSHWIICPSHPAFGDLPPEGLCPVTLFLTPAMFESRFSEFFIRCFYGSGYPAHGLSHVRQMLYHPSLLPFFFFLNCLFPQTFPCISLILVFFFLVGSVPQIPGSLSVIKNED
jgi:hypothetical protein